MILTDDEVQRSLAIIEDAQLIIPLAKQATHDLAQHVAARGKLPGYKIARGRAKQRAWQNEHHAIKKLLEAGLKEDDILDKRRLKSPAAIERLAPCRTLEGLTWFPYRSLCVVPETSDLEEVEF